MHGHPILVGCLLAEACVNLPHVEPRPRSEDVRERAAVRVDSDCSETDLPFDYGLEVAHASGVVISERHVLTADHVVACPAIPTVHVTLSDGRVFRMVVQREDSDADIARLVILSADTFGLGIAPPRLVQPEYDSTICVYPAFPERGGVCGPIRYKDVSQMHTVSGNSGAADYLLPGGMVGVHIQGNGTFARYAPVDESWLEGT